MGMVTNSWMALAIVAVVAICLCVQIFVSFSMRAAKNIDTNVTNPDWPFVFPGSDPMNDPVIIAHVRRFVLEPPSTHNYELEKPEVKDPSEMGHISLSVIPALFPNVTKGVFLEAGALDGETVSSTLYLEKELGWSGMLVEMTPLNHNKIRSKHRKAVFAPVCLSPKPWPLRKTMSMEYRPNKMRSRWGATIIEERFPDKNGSRNGSGWTIYTATVDCYPLQTLLLAANMTKIDFLSLDVEGAELQVLRTLEWEKFQIDVVHLDLLHTVEGFEATKKFLVSQGYVHLDGYWDIVHFVRKGFVRERNIRINHVDGYG